jgi:outer membrane protein OmpA-like peptidoglycan-associated protein
MYKTRRAGCALAAAFASLALLMLPNAWVGAAFAAGPPTVIDSQTIIRGLQPHTSGTRSLVVAPRVGAGGAAGGERKMILDIRFANDSNRLTQAAHAQLAQLAGALKSPELASSRFLIAGHTSATGSPEHNLRLSEARAQAVRGYLLKRFNIAPGRIEASGFGASHPLPDVAPDALEQRRVEISTLPRT